MSQVAIWKEMDVLRREIAEALREWGSMAGCVWARDELREKRKRLRELENLALAFS